MTEVEWLGAVEPNTMLVHLRGRASDRKLRLFAVACCWRIAELFTDPRSRDVLNLTELHADGLVSTKDVSRAAQRNYEFILGEPAHTLARVAAQAVAAAAGSSPWAAAWNVVS